MKNIKIKNDGNIFFTSTGYREIFGFKNTGQVLHNLVKQMYKTDLKSMELPRDILANPVPYHAGKAIYLSGAGL